MLLLDARTGDEIKFAGTTPWSHPVFRIAPGGTPWSKAQRSEGRATRSALPVEPIKLTTERLTVNDSAKRLCDELRREGIHDERVLAAMLTTPREMFVAPELAGRAYENVALQIDAGQTISQPFIVALMTQALQLSGDETVLDVGTGSGYQAAILAQVAARVVTIERLAELSVQAEQRLQWLGLDNIVFRVGDGTAGCAELGPYDGIVVAAAGPHVPRSLQEQLAPGGRLVIPTGSRERQTLQVVTRTAEGLVTANLCPCRFVGLIGAEGWQEPD